MNLYLRENGRPDAVVLQCRDYCGCRCAREARK